jgi:5-methylcytosine-specific restriction endonuclease McrA
VSGAGIGRKKIGAFFRRCPRVQAPNFPAISLDRRPGYVRKRCICGVVDCRQHGGAWKKKPAGYGWAYGAAYQRNRELLLARAGCIRGSNGRMTGQGGACAVCGRPGIPIDPLQADHIVPVHLGGGDEITNLRAIHRSEHGRRTAHQGHEAAKRRSFQGHLSRDTSRRACVCRPGFRHGGVGREGD